MILHSTITDFRSDFELLTKTPHNLSGGGGGGGGGGVSVSIYKKTEQVLTH